jgi:lariat debranching enzyme
MTHDWPVGITKYGDEKRLILFKPYFAEDIKNDRLGNPHSMMLVTTVRPQYWFSGHLHCRFQATVEHEISEYCQAESQTNFLALHKCNPKNMNQVFLDVSF